MGEVGRAAEGHGPKYSRAPPRAHGSRLSALLPSTPPKSLTIEAPVAGFAEWQMEPAVAAALEHLGWRADEPEVRDAVPAVLRGGNVVAVMPPVPSWSSPIL